jgi:lipopolysaccharide biosynthesis glycosyltransferase
MKFFKNKNQKSKNLIITISMKNFPNTAGKIAHKYMKLYAESINSDFAIITDEDSIYKNLCYNKFLMSDLFNEYERILYVDNDVFIKKNSPDIFKIVPPNKFGIVNEFKQFKNHPNYLKWKNKSLLKWWNQHNIKENKKIKYIPNRCFNAGVMVVSRETNIFKYKPIVLEKKCLYENYLVVKRLIEHNIKIHELDDGFNFMITRRMPKEMSKVMKYIKSKNNHFIHLIRYNQAKQIQEKMLLIEENLYKQNIH